MLPTVSFKVRCNTKAGERLVLTGSDRTLGSWDPKKSQVELATSSANYPFWTGALVAPVGTELLFKLCVMGKDGCVSWENKIDNRLLRVPGSDMLLSMSFNDGRLETMMLAPGQKLSVHDKGNCKDVGEEPPNRLQRKPSAVGQPEPEMQPELQPEMEPKMERTPSIADELNLPDLQPTQQERTLQEVLFREAMALRRAEIAESKAERCNKRTEEAEARAAAAEKQVAELMAKLALAELQGDRAETVNEVRAEVDVAATASHLLQAELSDEIHLQRMSRKLHETRVRRFTDTTMQGSSSASSTCDSPEQGWAVGPFTPRSEMSQQ